MFAFYSIMESCAIASRAVEISFLIDDEEYAAMAEGASGPRESLSVVDVKDSKLKYDFHNFYYDIDMTLNRMIGYSEQYPEIEKTIKRIENRKSPNRESSFFKEINIDENFLNLQDLTVSGFRGIKIACLENVKMPALETLHAEGEECSMSAKWMMRIGTKKLKKISVLMEMGWHPKEEQSIYPRMSEKLKSVRRAGFISDETLFPGQDIESEKVFALTFANYYRTSGNYRQGKDISYIVASTLLSDESPKNPFIFSVKSTRLSKKKSLYDHTFHYEPHSSFNSLKDEFCQPEENDIGSL